MIAMIEMKTSSGQKPTSVSIPDAEAVLGAMILSEDRSGTCGGPWAHELTPVVKYCGVARRGPRPVLQVNPTWLQELVANDDLAVLADEMHTWFEIERATAEVIQKY